MIPQPPRLPFAVPAGLPRPDPHAAAHTAVPPRPDSPAGRWPEWEDGEQEAGGHRGHEAVTGPENRPEAPSHEGLPGGRGWEAGPAGLGGLGSGFAPWIWMNW